MEYRNGSPLPGHAPAGAQGTRVKRISRREVTRPVGLLITGQPFLAATAGLLHAIGKFGSAWADPLGFRLWPPAWPDLWRSLVLASRIPGLLAAVISLVAETSANSTGMPMITAVTLIMCYLLWIRADLLLFESKS